MAKNNPMLAYLKYAKPKTESQLCDVYAAFCLALDEIGVPEDQIAKLCSMTQELWNRSAQEGWNMTDVCYKQTGIDVRLEVNKRG